MWGSTIKTGCCASISGFRWVTDSNKISKALISSSNVWVHCTTVYLCQHWFTLYDSACFAAIATTWKLNKYTSFRLSLLILKLGFSSIYHEPFIPFSIRRLLQVLLSAKATNAFSLDKNKMLPCYVKVIQATNWSYDIFYCVQLVLVTVSSWFSAVTTDVWIITLTVI